MCFRGARGVVWQLEPHVPKERIRAVLLPFQRRAPRDPVADEGQSATLCRSTPDFADSLWHLLTGRFCHLARTQLGCSPSCRRSSRPCPKHGSQASELLRRQRSRSIFSHVPWVGAPLASIFRFFFFFVASAVQILFSKPHTCFCVFVTGFGLPHGPPPTTPVVPAV